MRRAAALAALLLLAACAEGGRKPDYPSEWEQQHARELSEAQAPDVVPPLPAFPRQEDLVPFFVSSASDFKYFVDRRSIGVDGGQVRYTVVARSPSGAENVSFEALHCKEREFRSYARGTSEGGWIVRPTPWKRIEPRVQRVQYTLHWEYLCPNNVAVYTPAEGISALEHGGHPWSKLPTGAGR